MSTNRLHSPIFLVNQYLGNKQVSHVDQIGEGAARCEHAIGQAQEDQTRLDHDVEAVLVVVAVRVLARRERVLGQALQNVDRDRREVTGVHATEE